MELKMLFTAASVPSVSARGRSFLTQAVTKAVA